LEDRLDKPMAKLLKHYERAGCKCKCLVCGDNRSYAMEKARDAIR